MNETKPRRLVATLGPRSSDLAAELAAGGATGFRLNASHLSPEETGRLARAVRKAAPDRELVIDLQGAKMRLGGFVERRIAPGETVALSPAPREGTLPAPHPELFAEARVGETLGVDDGRLRFVVERRADDEIVARCLVGGALRPRKGINLLEHPVRLDGLSPRDRATLAALPQGPATIAFSFMLDGREAEWVRAARPDSRVAGKIERREAIDALPTIAAAVDEVWICRGDLGAQLGLPELARFVHQFDPRALPCPSLMAGQVLQHLARHDAPTRSEVCHLYDLLARGYEGIVLSDETAVGSTPARAVATAAALLSSL